MIVKNLLLKYDQSSKKTLINYNNKKKLDNFIKILFKLKNENKENAEKVLWNEYKKYEVAEYITRREQYSTVIWFIINFNETEVLSEIEYFYFRYKKIINR